MPDVGFGAVRRNAGGQSVAEPLFSASRALPGNIAAEQALLGAILANNRAFHDVAGFLLAEHFADHIHQQIYAEVKRLILQGRLVDGVVLKDAFEGAGVLDEVGGTAYIAQLLSAMVGILNAAEYARDVHDCWVRRQLIDLGTEAVNGAFGGDLTHSGEEQVRAAADGLMAIAGSASVEVPQVTAGEAAALALATAEARRRGDATGGISSGFYPVDKVIGELLPEFLYLLAGRPGMGKTSLAAQLAVGCARSLKREVDAAALFSGAGGWVVFYCLEMPAAQVGGWMACQMAGVDNSRLFTGDFTLEEAERLRVAQIELNALPIMLIDAVGMSGPSMALRTRSLHATKRVRLVVVDHLQKIMASAEVGREGMTAATSKTTSAFKDLARALKIPVLALAQLSREVDKREDKRPQLSDLMYAGEQDADVVAFLYRAERYLSRSPPDKAAKESDSSINERREHWHKQWDKARGKAELIVAKRRNGPEDDVTLGFDGPTTTFSEIGFGMVDSLGSPAFDPPVDPSLVDDDIGLFGGVGIA